MKSWDRLIVLVVCCLFDGFSVDFQSQMLGFQQDAPDAFHARLAECMGNMEAPISGCL